MAGRSSERRAWEKAANSSAPEPIKTRWWKAYAAAAIWVIEALAHAAGAPGWLVWLGAAMTPVAVWGTPNPPKDS